MSKKPAFIATSNINIDGKSARRLMAVYSLKGCEKAQRGKKCAMCNFEFYANVNATDKEAMKQHDEVLNRLRRGKFSQIDLLCLGNFFNDKEVSPELRKYMLDSLAGIRSIKRVLVDSRTEYANNNKLMESKKQLRSDQRLVFALGYETSNKHIRNDVLKKDVSEQDLTELLKACKKADVDFSACVLIKPPTLSELEAIKDASDTAIHVLNKAKRYGVNAYIAFEPVFVPENTELNELFIKGIYRPPMIWTVIETIIQTAKKLKMRNTRGKLFVGLSDENLSGGRCVSNRCNCDKAIIKKIQEFNGHQNISALANAYHYCKDDWNRNL